MEPNTRYGDVDGTDNYIEIYNYPVLTLIDQIDFPEIELSTGHYQTHGRYIFHEADGQDIVSVIQIDDTSGALFDFWIYLIKR